MQAKFVRSFLYLLLVLVFAQPAVAQQVVARKQFDHAKAIRVIGETAYVVSGSGLFLYDITDKANPKLRSSLLINDNSSFDLEVAPPYVYVLSGERRFETSTITAVNIGNRAKPVIVSQYQGFGGTQPKDFILRFGTLVVANANRLELLSVSDPKNIRRISSLPVVPQGAVQSLVRDGSVIYASYRHSNRSGIAAVDVTNSGNPKVLSRLSFAGTGQGAPPRLALALSNHVLYVARSDQRVEFYDVSNPASPKSSGTLSVIAPGLAAEDNLLFVETGEDRVSLFEISNPLSPRFAREVQWFGTTAGMDIDAVQLEAFVQWTELGRSGLAILKFKNDGTYALQSNLPAVVGSDVEATASVTYLTGSNKLAAVQRVPGKQQIRELGNIAFFESLQSMEVQGSRVYISTLDSESKPGIRIVDVSDLAHMQPLGYLQLDPSEVPAETTQPRFDVQQNVLVLALQKSGLAIYDVSNGTFQQVAIFDTANSEQSLNATVQNGIAFLCTRSGGQLNLYVIDVQNPARPTLLAKLSDFDAGQMIHDLKVDGNFLYVTGTGKNKASGRFYIFSITTPDKPVLLSKTFTGASTKSGNAQEIQIQSDVAYVADGVDGISLFDVTNKSNPQRVGVINTPSFARGVSIDAQKQLHVADETCYLLFR